MIRTLSILATVGILAAQPRYFANIQTYQVRPITGSTYSLGTTGARWTNFFTDRITLTTGAGNGFTASIHPSADASYDIGSIASGNYRFKDVFLSGALNAYSLDLNAGTAITGNIRSSTASTYSLGTTGNRWTNSFFDRITLSTTAGLGFASSLQPSADNTHTLGDASYRWASAQIAGTLTTGAHLSQAASTYALGSTGNRWTNVFSDNLTVTTGIRLGTSATNGHVMTTDVSGNLSLQAIPIAAFATAGILTAGTQSISGDKTFLDTTALAAVNLTGTLTMTGTIQASSNNLYNIGSSTNNFRAVYLNQLFVGNVRGLTTTVVVPCGTLTFTEGILTNKGAC